MVGGNKRTRAVKKASKLLANRVTQHFLYLSHLKGALRPVKDIRPADVLFFVIPAGFDMKPVVAVEGPRIPAAGGDQVVLQVC